MSVYTLVEVNDCGVPCREDFPAPDDRTAIARVQHATGGEDVLILQGERQVFPTSRRHRAHRKSADALAVA